MDTKKFDWIWNTLAVICIVITGTFVTNTLHAFSQNGLDLIQTFGAISQGAGLLLITGGTLTDSGRQIIQRILASFNVSSRYQAEGTFTITFIVLIASGSIYFSLPFLGEYYYKKGYSEYQSGNLTMAMQNLEEATNFATDQTELSNSINTTLGNIYETLGDQDKAEPFYLAGSIAGAPSALNGLGRVQMYTAWYFEDLLMAESSFRVGLAQPNLNPALKAEMLSHLGMALIKQADKNKDQRHAKLKEAEKILLRGIEVDKTLTKRTAGLGLSHCYLAIVYKKLNQPHEWDNCTAHALPTSLIQFSEIVMYAGSGIADNINTKGIVDAN